MHSLERHNIFLNRKTLSNLAIWEPRTFKVCSKFDEMLLEFKYLFNFQSIVNLAWCTAYQQNFKGVDALGPPPQNVLVPKVDEKNEELD
jgi:hypothetical protein